MAELATLARPYAEALFQVAVKGDLSQTAQQTVSQRPTRSPAAARLNAAASSNGTTIVNSKSVENQISVNP